MTKTDDKTPQLSEWGQISKSYLEQKKEMELSYHEVEDSELETLVEEAMVEESVTSEVDEAVEGGRSSEADSKDLASDEDGESDDVTEEAEAEDESAEPETQEPSETSDSESAEEESDDVLEAVSDGTSERMDDEDWEDVPLAASRYSNETVIKAGLVSLVAVLILFFSIFSITPLGTKKDITLTGAEHVTIEQVLADTGIRDSDYLLTVLVNQNRYKDNLKRLNPWVKEVAIHYTFPFGLTFDIKEEEVVAYGQTVDGLKPILANGLRLSTSGKTGVRGHFITVEFDNATEIKALAKELKALSKNLRETIQFISYETKGTRSDLLLLEMTDGHSVRVPLAHLSQKLPYYEKIAPRLTETSIVDMEVGIYVTTPLIEETKVKVEETPDATATDTVSDTAAANTTSEQTP